MMTFIRTTVRPAAGVFLLLAGLILVTTPSSAGHPGALPLARQPIEVAVDEVANADTIAWVGPEFHHDQESRRLVSEARSAMADAQRALTHHDQGRATEHIAHALDLMADLSWHTRAHDDGPRQP